MTGTTIRATLCHVVLEHDELEPRDGEAAKLVVRELYLVTADHSGGDLFEVARHAALNGRALEGRGVAITFAKRITEVRGTAIAAGGAN